MDELVRETEAMEKDGGRKRREPMQVLLWRAQQAIDEAKESKLVPEDALAEARERRERVYKEEQARIVVEEAEKLAGEQCLDAAFAQTMLFMFSPSKSGSLADGMTAADRRRQSEESAAEARRRAEAGAEHGTLLWAEAQTEGRGRRGPCPRGNAGGPDGGPRGRRSRKPAGPGARSLGRR